MFDTIPEVSTEHAGTILQAGKWTKPRLPRAYLSSVHCRRLFEPRRLYVSALEAEVCALCYLCWEIIRASRAAKPQQVQTSPQGVQSGAERTGSGLRDRDTVVGSGESLRSSRPLSLELSSSGSP